MGVRHKASGVREIITEFKDWRYSFIRITGTSPKILLFSPLTGERLGEGVSELQAGPSDQPADAVS
jgi:hypothetical protein